MWLKVAPCMCTVCVSNGLYINFPFSCSEPFSMSQAVPISFDLFILNKYAELLIATESKQKQIVVYRRFTRTLQCLWVFLVIKSLKKNPFKKCNALLSLPPLPIQKFDKKITRTRTVLWTTTHWTISFWFHVYSTFRVPTMTTKTSILQTTSTNSSSTNGKTVRSTTTLILTILSVGYVIQISTL